ncbi:MAG: PAS domain-containing protein, partial [Actinomycetota bacterium]
MPAIDSFCSEIEDSNRLEILRQSGLLDGAPDAAFDRLVRLACRILEAPAAFIVLMGEERQYFKSAIGLSEGRSTPDGNPLTDCFGQFVVAAGEPLAVSDARADPRRSGDGKIADLEVASYLGCPLVLPGDCVLGAFSVVDSKPRTWTDEQVDLLRDLTHCVVTEIRMRLAMRQSEDQAREAAAEQELHAHLLRDVDAVVWEADPRTWCFSFVSQRAETWFGYPISRWLTEPGFWANLIHPEDREQAVETCTRASASGEDHEFEYRVITADGSVLWLRDIVRVILDAEGRPIRLRGVLIDISAQKRAQERVEHVVSSALCLLWEATVEVSAEGLCWDLFVLDEAAAQRFLPLVVDAGETYGAAWQGCRLPEDRAGIEAVTEEAIRSAQPRYTHEYRCRSANGEIRWLADDVQIEPLGHGRW